MKIKDIPEDLLTLDEVIGSESNSLILSGELLVEESSDQGMPQQEAQVDS